MYGCSFMNSGYMNPMYSNSLPIYGNNFCNLGFYDNSYSPFATGENLWEKYSFLQPRIDTTTSSATDAQDDSSSTNYSATDMISQDTKKEKKENNLMGVLPVFLISIAGIAALAGGVAICKNPQGFVSGVKNIWNGTVQGSKEIATNFSTKRGQVINWVKNLAKKVR